MKKLNEPVVYRHFHGEENGEWEYYDAPTGDDCEGCQPLFTTPPDQSQRIKELESQLSECVSALIKISKDVESRVHAQIIADETIAKVKK